MVDIVNAYDANYIYVNNEVQKYISYVKDRLVYIHTDSTVTPSVATNEIESKELRIQLPRKRVLSYIRRVTAHR